MKKMAGAVTVGIAFVLLPTAAGAAPVTGGVGAGYGGPVSDHARDGTDFSRQMNPGHHHGFAGFDEHQEDLR